VRPFSGPSVPICVCVCAYMCVHVCVSVCFRVCRVMPFWDLKTKNVCISLSYVPLCIHSCFYLGGGNNGGNTNRIIVYFENYINQSK